MNSPPPIRPEIANTLAQLRGRIRRYVLIEGSAIVCVVLGLLFWCSLGIDYWLELPRSIRWVLRWAAGLLFCGALLRFLVLRLIGGLRNRALALVLERRFPDLNDRLITTVENAESRDAISEVTAAMLHRVADEVAELAHRLQLREVFNVRPLLRSALLAALLLISIGGFGWSFSTVFNVWLQRNLLMADEYYPRETDLHVAVLAEPNERLCEFHDGVYKHPRGADLTLLAEVPPGKLIPDQVRFSYHLASRTGGRDAMTKIGQRQFRHTIPALHDNLRIWLKAGDYSTRAPYQVQVVDPPRLDAVALEARYPAYTGKNRRDEQSGGVLRDVVAVQGAQVALPAGTDFVLATTVNKPLVRVELQTAGFDLVLTRPGASLRVHDRADAASGGHSRAIPQDQPWLASNGLGFRVPLLLTVAAAPALVSPAGEVLLPLRLPPDAALRIILHDEDDIISGEPARLTINSLADQPPAIESQLKGVGGSITRQAVIPVAGTISDDYGVTSARFEYQLDGRDSVEPRAFATAAGGRAEFAFSERFEVLPLDLAIGRKLTLTVAGDDADDLTGPHHATGEKFVFQIVSNDELLAIIATRELNLRRQFEQIIEELKATRKDLTSHRDRLEESRLLRDKAAANRGDTELRERIAAVDLAVLGSTDRALGGVLKNANETASIEQRFRDIRDELENNAVPDVKPLLDRIDEGIVKPLHAVNTTHFNNLADALTLLKQALEKKSSPQTAVDGAIEQLNGTIERLEAVLAQMLKLETFNEALQMLREIIKIQEDLHDNTKNQRKRKLIEGLK